MKKSIAFVICAACALVLASACSSAADVPESSDTSAVAVSASSAVSVQSQMFGTGDSTITCTNKTGREIADIALKDSTAADYGSNLMLSSERVAEGESFILKYTDSGSSSVSTASGDIVTRSLYDLRITFTDGTIAVIPQVGLKGLQKADLCYSPTDELGYIEYIDSTTGSTASTLENSKDIKNRAAASNSVPATENDNTGSASDDKVNDGDNAADEEQNTEQVAAEENNESGSGGSSESGDSGNNGDNGDSNAQDSANQETQGCVEGGAAFRS